MIIKVKIPDILVKIFKVGSPKDKEAIVEYFIDSIYEALLKGDDDGKN